MRIRYSIRDMLLVTAIVALSVGWWVEHARMADKIVELSTDVQPAAVIEGQVIYADSGKPAAGVVVRVQANPISVAGSRTSDGKTKTDDEGRYRFINLAPGNYNIFAEADGWTMNAIESLPLVAGQTVNAADLRLTKGGFIKGHIVDEDSGKRITFEYRDNPIILFGGQRIEVAVYGPARPRSLRAVEHVPVDSNGEFKIRVPAGTNCLYLMNVDRQPIIKGEQYMDEGVSFEDGKTTEIEFSVKTSSSGSPPAGAPRPASPSTDGEQGPGK